MPYRKPAILLLFITLLLAIPNISFASERWIPFFVCNDYSAMYDSQNSIPGNGNYLKSAEAWISKRFNTAYNLKGSKTASILTHEIIACCDSSKKIKYLTMEYIAYDSNGNIIESGEYLNCQSTIPGSLEESLYTHLLETISAYQTK